MVEIVDESPATPAPPKPYMPVKAETEDWCTPPEIVDVVRRTFGGAIDLDPATNPHSVVRAATEIMLPKWSANVDADRDLAEREARGELLFADGIRVPWKGSVFTNPPYGYDLDAFMDRSVRASKSDEDASVIMLAPCKTSRKCWQRTVPHAKAVCFIEGRVQYLLPGGARAGATFSSALILWTRDRELVHRFAWYLDRKVGHVVFTR